MDLVLPRVFIALNPRSHGGRGLELWDSLTGLKDECDKRYVTEVFLGFGSRLDDAVQSFVSRGGRYFLAAGGDGTVNALLNAIIARRGTIPCEEFALGAIGLGSSNDFHKPVRTTLNGIPVRLNFKSLQNRDIGTAVLSTRDNEGRRHEVRRHFLVSCSMGVTAEANRFFNDDDRALRLLKRYWTNGAILYAAIRSILYYKNIPARFESSSDTRSVQMTSLSVLKTPYLGGTFRFDTPVDHASGTFAVNYMVDMGIMELISTLVALSKGSYSGRPKCFAIQANRLAVSLPEATALEVDGEIFYTDYVEFSIHNERIKVCG
ncbi:MAG: diacylglycerol kinase family protein [Bdellovibrionota bacterium]